jgi:hypothetical protein
VRFQLRFSSLLEHEDENEEDGSLPQPCDRRPLKRGGRRWTSSPFRRRQVSNLQKTSNSFGNSDSPPQIAPQKLADSLSGLDSVVESWPALPPALKAAILAIVNSSENNR